MGAVFDGVWLFDGSDVPMQLSAQLGHLLQHLHANASNHDHNRQCSSNHYKGTKTCS